MELCKTTVCVVMYTVYYMLCTVLPCFGRKSSIIGNASQGGVLCIDGVLPGTLYVVCSCKGVLSAGGICRPLRTLAQEGKIDIICEADRRP